MSGIATREDFMKWLYHKYEKFWASLEHFNTSKDDYKIVLTESTDYKELHKSIIMNYQDTFKPPSPAYFQEILLQARISKSQEFKKYEPQKDGVPPTAEYLAFRKKLFAK